jgi:GNAT superfamily N-acetyltransferase
MTKIRVTGAPPWLHIASAADRPDLWDASSDGRFHDVWPEYNHHGNHSGIYFGALYPAYADLQVLLVDARSEQVVARGRTIPFCWDGSLDDLPSGIDAVGLRAVEAGDEPTALSALAAEILPSHQGQGISAVVIQAMAAVAKRRGLGSLVAPVRPSWKDRYPITPIERYITWQRSDGLLLDPWMRVHERLGASILRAAPQSLEISQPIESWTRWVDMQFPDNGGYVFPGGLAPLTVVDGIGEYWEPNVWMLHEVAAVDAG